MNKAEMVAEIIIDTDQNRIYFLNDNVEIIFNSDMECWILLDFNSMKFKTGDLDDLLENLSTRSLINFLKENEDES